MTWLNRLLPTAAILVLPVTWASGEVEIRSPGSAPSKVTGDGTLVEPWGAVRLRIVNPENARVAEQRAESAPMPMAVTRLQAGPIVLTESAYRAPVWPSGVDVLEAAVTNAGEAAAKVELELVVPEGMQIGESTGAIEGTPSLVLPAGLAPIRQERDWGCTDAVSALPGWAKPSAPCDPAFRSISAGMGGVPIRYRFHVEPGSKRTVVLGFCESHHPGPGLRPLVAQVEGAAERAVDPVAAWGRHVPGVERFDAADANGDGRLEVAVASHPRASDRNTILNVIWVFDAKTKIDEKKLIAGELSDQAQYYVDVGSEKDQLFYMPGNVRFALDLGPKEQRDFFFLIRSPGCQQLPDPSQGLWNRENLRKAAAEVWKDRWAEPAPAAKK
ncbi:MAG: hypothetical protein ACYC6Y_18530 [Thermoguttaceae bacterium]